MRGARLYYSAVLSLVMMADGGKQHKRMTEGAYSSNERLQLS